MISRRLLGRYPMILVFCGWMAGIGGVACRSAATAQTRAKELHMNVETSADMRTIAGSRVFWGHQSVGGNVIEGLKELLTESQTPWPVVELGKDTLPAGPVFMHERIGENGNPKGKMDAFARVIHEMPEPKPRLAFMKLCYVDVNRNTDVEGLIAYYKMTLSKLKSEYPNIVFAHATVPLAPEAGGIKDRIKRLIGIELKKERDNLRRNQYNALLRKTFPTDRLFSLDRVESTRKDGSRVQFQMDGQTALALAKEYAADESGHLNVLGEKLAAMELVRFMAGAITH